MYKRQVPTVVVIRMGTNTLAGLAAPNCARYRNTVTGISAVSYTHLTLPTSDLV